MPPRAPQGQPDSPDSDPDAERESARSTGTGISAPQTTTHGVMYQSLARGLAAVSGYALHVVAARWLGAESYGNLVLVLSIMLWGKNLQSHFLVPGMVKVVSEDPRRLSAALGVARRWYAPAALVSFVVVLAVALGFGGMADSWGIAVLLAVGAAEIPLAATHRLSCRLLLATRRYIQGSVVLSTYTVLRAVLGCSLILLGAGALGGVSGQVLGSGAAALVGVFLLFQALVRYPHRDYSPMLSRALSWTGFMLPAMVAMTTLLSIDLWMVKGLTESGETTGLYGAAYTLARAPRLFAVAMAGSVFPRVSGELADGSDHLARSVARDAVRTVIIIFVPVCVLVGGSAAEVITFLFSQTYTAAGMPLVFLITAGSLGALLTVLLALVAAANHPGVRLGVVLGLVPLSALANWVLIPRYGLVGAAGGTAMVMATGALVSYLYTRRYLELKVPAATCLRCGAAGLAVGLAAGYWPATGWMVIPKLGAFGALYLVLLLGTGEIGLREIRMVVNALPGPIRHRISSMTGLGDA